MEDVEYFLLISFLFRYFKQEALSTNRDQRVNALKQIKAVVAEQLKTMKKEKEQCEWENENMRKAVEKLTKMRNANPQM